MFKKVLLIAILMMAFLSVGCDSSNTDNVKRENSQNQNRFYELGDTYSIGSEEYDIFVDRKTNMVYLHFSTGAYKEVFTIMYDELGQPMTLKKYEKTR